MPEWLAIIVAGIIGGLFGTFLPAGVDVPFPASVRELLEKTRARGLLYHVLRNSLYGGVASFLLWGMYNAQASFTGHDLTVRTLAVSIVVGGAGVSIVNGLFRQAQKGVAIDNLARAINELLPPGEQDGQARRGQHEQ